MTGAAPAAVPRGYLWPTPEQEVILSAAIGPDAAAVAAFRQWSRSADFSQHFDSGVFRLLPLVYRRMQALGVAAPAMPTLKGVYRQAWCNAQMLLHGVAPVLAALRAENIELLLLKGAPLQHIYYKGIGLRPMADVDIAVRGQDLRKVIALLQATGWATPSMDAEIAKHRTAPRNDSDLAGEYLSYNHAIQFRNSEGFEIDLHHHFLYDAFNAPGDAWFWKSSVPFAFMGVEASRLDATAALLHVIIHGLRPNPEPPIRWIVDAHFILAEALEEIRWADMLAFARTLGLTHRLNLGLSYIAQRFGAPVPGFVLDELRRTKIGFAEWVEHKFLLNMEQPTSLLGWLCLGVAEEVRRSQGAGWLQFLAFLNARIRRRLGLQLKSVLARGG